jgi:hypothetical protein
MLIIIIIMALIGDFTIAMFMCGLGAATGFVLRDELTMPTYLRIKMSMVEHSILTRRKLDANVLSMLDPNLHRNRIQERAEQTDRDHYRAMGSDQTTNENNKKE